MGDTKLIGAPVVDSPAKLTVEVKASASVNNVICCSEKRKRGRPPRGAVAMKGATPVKRRREEVDEQEEEDVCFICFDGGSLVLCDRKGCPKAYHPTCIKRDEAFFRAAAKWTCGWHICSVCQKTSHNMCYTCTYSVCRGCTKNADYFRVRGNKGFCSACMKIIMLIENIDQGNKETVQVDFDDKSSWEYLFKVYWMYLKEKLLLTQSELIQAKNHREESDPVHAKRQRLPFGHRVILDGKGAVCKSFDHLELKKPKQLLEPPYKDPPSTCNQTIAEFESLSVSSCTPQMELKQPIQLELRRKDSMKTEEETIATRKSLNGSMEWASKELLELVAHMKNGDTSALSHFDVQALLLKYIKRNNLRDPRQKSQIICDSRLKGLFGKPRVGHIEMLKLLQFHFLMKEDSQKSAFIPAGIVGTVTSQVESVDNNDISFLRNKTKKHKSHRSSEEKLVQINLDEYAAIDVHNINLIYLRRDLMESLIEDMEKFHGKVIGSVVRIRISSSDQKQEIYRLVHVVGTSMASVPYKINDKTANVLLEVLNLNKKEAVPIDSISNQDFCEDECRRLRQIIKCGLVKPLTIGEIQKKAIDLLAVKLNDSLEAEIVRLNHLRDRASEKGRRKELRECVEKLELLKAPEERQRRLLTIPEVHADPKMDPSYESEEDARESKDRKQVEYQDPRYTRFSRREDKLMSSVGKVKEESIVARHKFSEKGEAHGNNILKKLGNQGTLCQGVDRSSSETSTASISAANSTSTNNSETEKLWHYRDPNGRIQGPFSVMQLRKWNKSGLFPPDMRIWTNDEHDDAVLLTNALNGLFLKASRVYGDKSHQSQQLAAPVNNGVGWCGNAAGTGRECGEHKVPLHIQITRNCSNGNSETVRMDRSSSSFRRCLDLNSSYSDKTQPSYPVPSSSHGDVYVAALHGKRCHEIGNIHYGTSHVVKDSSGSTISQISDDIKHGIQSNNQRHLGKSFEQNQGSLTSNKGSANMNSGSSFATVTKTSNCSEQKCIKGSPDLPSPTPKASYDDVEAQVAEELLSLSSGIQVCAFDKNLPSPTPHLKGETPDGQAAAMKESFPSSSTVQDSGPSWSSACSLVIGGTQPPEATNEGDGCSPASRPSVDSALVSNSSLKPLEAVGDHVDTPTLDANLKAETSDDQAAAKNESFPSNFPVQDSAPSWSSTCSVVIGGTQLPERTSKGGGCSPASRPSVDSGLVSDSSLKPAEAVGDHVDTPTSDANLKAETPDDQAAAMKESFPCSFPVQDSGPSLSSSCSLVIGGSQLPEITNEGGGCSPASRPSVDSGIVSDSSLKPAEAVGDHVDTPTSDANLKAETPDDQAAAKKESFPSSFPVQDSGSNWSSTCSLVIGGTQLLEINNEGGRCSPALRPSVDSGLVSDSPLKPAEAVGDHADTPTSDANQLNQTSPSNTVSIFLDWEPIEFTTLDEESVSDLLAEVDAMEFHTQSGMGSPTSDMRCSDEMISASISDCFSSIEELSPTFDPTKNDALSSTDDVQLHCRSSLTDELARASQTDAFDPLKRSSGNSSSSSEGETKSADVSFPHGGAGYNVATPYTLSRETAVSIDTGCRAAPGNMTWHGAVQGYANVGHDSSMITAWGNSSMNCPPFTGNPVFGSQCIYSGEGCGDAGPRDWVVPVGDSGFGRDRSYKQPFGAVCGYSRPPPKGQQVCKYYDSGHCRKGASCDYLHL